MRTLLRSVALAAALTATTLAVPGAAHAAKSPWHVTIHANTTTVSVGHRVFLKGKVGQAAAGRLVTLQERYATDKPWKDQRNARVHADGSYTTYDRPTQNHRRLYRVVIPASGRHSRGVSESVIVEVYEWTTLTSIPAANQSGIYDVPSVTMNAVAFPTSVEAYLYVDGPTTGSIEFNLNHRCTRFRGTFGISDDSESGSEASVLAQADGAPWFNHTYAVGQSDHNVFDFETPPLKVRFETTSLVDGLDGLGAVGAPEVYCTQ